MPGGNRKEPGGQTFGAGRGRGQVQGKGRKGGPFAAGPGGNCICQQCGHKEPHSAGEPCNQKACPQCGAVMTRE